MARTRRLATEAQYDAFRLESARTRVRVCRENGWPVADADLDLLRAAGEENP